MARWSVVLEAHVEPLHEEIPALPESFRVRVRVRVKVRVRVRVRDRIRVIYSNVELQPGIRE